MRKGLIIVLIVIFGTIFLSSLSHAVHKGAGGLTCGQCHTMHNSQGGTTLEGAATGSILLLRADVSSRAEIHKLCLQCHADNGSMANTSHAPQNVQAPKVYSSAAWSESDPFNKIGSGGNFSTELDTSWGATTGNYLGYGHSLGATNVTPPGGDTSIAEFSCTNCHDPHGANVENDADINMFRNLKVNATGAGANSGALLANGGSGELHHKHISYVGGVSGIYYSSYFGGSETDNAGNVIWPIYRGTLTGNPSGDKFNSNSYANADQLAFGIIVDGLGPSMGRWCAQCHDSWHEAIETANKVLDESKRWTSEYEMFRVRTRHPAMSLMPRRSAPRCAETCHKSALDRINYNVEKIQAGKGLPVTVANAGTVDPVYYLPWQPPAPPNTVMDPWAPQVFCLSCHFAHGGPYLDNLRWDYLASVASGEQTANGIASDVGCQLCHNR